MYFSVKDRKTADAIIILLQTEQHQINFNFLPGIKKMNMEQKTLHNEWKKLNLERKKSTYI